MTAPDPELARLLQDLRPAELALRDWVRTRLNASIVREISTLDHGMQIDEHRDGIEELMVARRLPADLPWSPREVLELCSYTVVRDPEPSPGSDGWRGHVARLFSCLVLVRATDTPAPAEALAALVESALALGPEATGAALRYLAWCRLQSLPRWQEAESRPFLTLGLLLVYATPRHPALEAALRQALADETLRQPGPRKTSPWRPLVDLHLTTPADRPVRAWFRLPDPPH